MEGRDREGEEGRTGRPLRVDFGGVGEGIAVRGGTWEREARQSGAPQLGKL